VDLTCGSSSPPPSKKKKLEGGGENSPSHPISSPRLPTSARAEAGRDGAREQATNGSQQVQASAGPRGRVPSLGPGPSPPPRASCPARPGGGRLHRGWGGGGGGAGVPRRRILPRGWRRGERDGGRGDGREVGNGGLRRTRARHERGPREASWVKSGRAAPRERGEEPRSEVRALEPRELSPPRESSQQEEPFCFRPRLQCSPIDQAAFPGLRERGAPRRSS
jgi:hypothetical protein